MNITRPFITNFYDMDYATYKKRLADADLVDIIRSHSYDRSLVFPNKRSILDRSFDMLLTPMYMSAGLAHSAVRDDLSAGEAILSALRAGNPFGKGYEKGEYTYSKWLEELGWKPETTAGKIAKGTAGFVLDVLLDPTTYMTFGTSALLKGTGKSGAALHGFKEMSKEAAEEIIKKQAKERGLVLSAKEIATDAEKLAKEFNRLAGFRDKKEGITLSLGNMPFGDRLFGEAAKKKVTLVSGDKLQQIGERTIAPFYARLRDSIYGSKLGELFSTKTPLYRMSKEDPAKLYDFLKFIEYTRGIRQDKIAMEKAIRDKAKALMLSPAEQKQVIELLQDKTIWNKVAQTVKFLDTKEAKQYKKRIREQLSKAQAELENLRNKKKHIEALEYANRSKMIDAQIELEMLRHEYQEELANLKVGYLDKSEEIKGVIKELEDEIKRIDEELELMNKAKKSTVNRDDILKQIELYEVQKGLREDYQKTTKYKKLKTGEVKIHSAQKESIEAGEMIKRMDETPDNITARYKLIESISEYVFGNKESIAKTIWENDLNRLVDMIKSGKSKKEIERFIEKHHDYYSGRAQLIYPFLGKVIGYGKGMRYKNWDEFYHQRMNEILKVEMDGGKLTPAEEARKAELKQFDLKRKKLLKEINKRKSIPDVIEFIKEFDRVNNAKIYDELVRDELVEKRRSTFVDHDSAIIDDLRNKDMRYKDQISQPEQRELIVSDVLQHLKEANIIKDVNKIGEGTVRYVQRIADEAIKVAKYQFGADDYGKLTDKQKRAIINIAKFNDFQRTQGKKVKYGDKAIERFKQRVREVRAERNRAIMAALKEKPDAEVLVMFPDRMGYGTVRAAYEENGEIVVEVMRRGEVFKVSPDQIVKVKLDKKLRPDEIVKKAETVDLVQRKKELVKQIEQRKDELKKLKGEVGASVRKLTDEFKSRADVVKFKIVDLERSKQALQKAFTEKNDAEIHELTRKIKKMQDVLASDEAFETYMRTYLGQKRFDEITHPPEAARIMLDTMPIDEQIKEVVKVLRADFIQMGEKEVSIGVLGKEQFEEMMMHYLTHVLTPEGEKLFKSKLFQKHKSAITHDLGYGLKWNPYAKSRTIKKAFVDGKWIDNPTIEQINKSLIQNPEFNRILKGKNAFSEDLADIYLTRALKHAEILYDDKYMHNMMRIFGKEIKTADELQDGYKAVMNYGMAKKMMNDVASMKLSMLISFQLTEFLKDNIMKAGKKLLKDDIKRLVDVFFKEVWTEEVIKSSYDDLLKETIKDMGFTEESLGTLATPMLELKKEQIEIIQKYFDDVRYEYTNLINKRRKNYEKYGADNEQWERLEKAFRKLDNLTFPQIVQVNDAIVQKANQARKIQIAKDHNRFLDMIDKFTHFIKLNQTTVMPSFHARNKLSNIFNNWLAIGKDAVNLDMQKKAWHAVKHKGNVKKVKDVILIPDGKNSYKVMHWSEIYELARLHNVIDEGFFAKDIGAGAATTGKLPISPKFDPTDTKNFILYQKGAEIGNLIENSDRLLHFASMLKRGKSIEEAAESSKKFLFDYSDITAFEQSVMKRVFPYYVWLRKNSKLQIEQMIEQPEKYRDVAKVLNGVEGMVNEEERINKGLIADFAKDWVQTPFHVKNPEGRYEPVLWNPNLPFMDMSRMPNPFDLRETAKDLFVQTNPLLKAPIEAVFNKNVFFEAPIVREGESPVIKGADYMTNQFAIPNALQGVATKRGADLGLHILNSLTGVKMLSYDYDRYKFWKIKEILEQQSDKSD